MEKRVLPPDIKAYIRRKFLKRFLKCVIGEIIVILFLVFFGKRMFYGFGIINQTIIYILLLSIPFFVSGIPVKLIDSNWSGEVIHIKVVTRTNTITGFGRLGLAMYVENAIILFIKKHNSNVIIEEALALGIMDRRIKLSNYPVGRIENHLDDFRIGDEVYHFFGIDNLLVLHKTRNDSVKCIVCGTKNSTMNDKCNYCGYTLIK